MSCEELAIFFLQILHIWLILWGLTHQFLTLFIIAFMRKVTIFRCLVKSSVIPKEWELEKETKVNSEFLFSGIIFILLPAFYLIIWPMTHQRFFYEIDILEIGELVSF